MVPNAATSPSPDHVIGAFTREGLNPALAATHRAGFGPQTRVIDGTRGDVGRQLDRAGLRLLGESTLPAEAILIVVSAPGRVAKVAELFSKLGAETVTLASHGTSRPVPDSRPALTPDIRLPSDVGAVTEA